MKHSYIQSGRLDAPWLVVFDLDGTLIDSSEDLWLSVNAALEYVGAKPLQPQVITSYIGDGAPTLMRRALGEPTPVHVQERALRFFLDFYRDHKLDHTKLYPGVLDALERMRGLAPELPFAVLTNKPIRPSEEICEALGLMQYFFAVLGGDSLATKKPEPEGLFELMSRARGYAGNASGVSRGARGVVLVGDSDVDVYTARRARAQSLGCLYGLAPERLLASEPDSTCLSAAEWPEKLGLLR